MAGVDDAHDDPDGNPKAAKEERDERVDEIVGAGPGVQREFAARLAKLLGVDFSHDKII